METPVEVMIRLIEENPNAWESIWSNLKKTCLEMEKHNLIHFHIAGQKLKDQSAIIDMYEMKIAATTEYDNRFRS